MSDEHRESAEHLNRLPKYVLTRRGCDTSGWANSHALGDDWAERLTALRREPGKDIAVFGGGQAARAVLDAELADEVRLIVNPVVLGGGTPLFAGAERRQMELLDLESFASGAVVLRYRPRPAEKSL